MNSIVLHRDGSRNESSFENFSPNVPLTFSSVLHGKNVVKWLKSWNSRWRANKIQTIHVYPIRLWNICVHRKTHFCQDALLQISPQVLPFAIFFPDSFGHSKSLSPECKWPPLWGTTMASEDRYRFFKFWGKWFVLTIVVTLQLLVLPWFLQSKFLYWNKVSYKCASLVYIVYLL